jgi:DNA replication protein DnaC
MRREEYITRVIPRRFWNARFDGLTPIHNLHISIPRQQKVIDEISKNKLGSYSLFGPTGVGKTHILCVLANHAIMNGRHVIFTTCSQILKSARDVDIDKNFSDGAEIDHYWNKYISYANEVNIFVDEWDKIKASEYAYNILFNLINLVYNNPSKMNLSIASNLTPKDFESIFGAAMIRKLKDVSKLIVYGA